MYNDCRSCYLLYQSLGTMKKLLLILLLCGCTVTQIEPELQVEIRPNLEYHYPYYYLDVINSEQQTLVNLEGMVTIDGMIPEKPLKAEWKNNLYWTLVYNEYTQEYERLVTHYPSKVATINHSSYSNMGVINTMIAPIYEMKGDTMVVILTVETISDTVRIILQ